MVHQMMQEGTLWPNSALRLGPHWRNCKITWANIVYAVLNVGTKKHNKGTIVNMVEAVANAVAHS